MTFLSTCARSVLAISVLLYAWPRPAHAASAAAAYLASVSEVMVQMAPRSTMAALTMRDIYRPFFDDLVLRDYGQIETALANGGLVPLPPEPHRFNVALRLGGANPIGEMDLANQASYVAARPAAIGALLDLASRVKSGPVEITSLVRHIGYQDALRTTNWNAATELPTHTMGIAFDVAVINTPLQTVLEIRDALRQMSEAGDVIVIGERHQLVFHVVPHPSRLGHYSALYANALRQGPGFEVPGGWSLALTPSVTATVAALRPTPEHAAEWWAAHNAQGDVAIEVRPEPAAAAHAAPAAPPSLAPPARSSAGRYLQLIGNLMELTWATVTRWTQDL